MEKTKKHWKATLEKFQTGKLQADSYFSDERDLAVSPPTKLGYSRAESEAVESSDQLHQPSATLPSANVAMMGSVLLPSQGAALVASLQDVSEKKSVQ